MAGQLDSLFKSVAKQVVADLGSSFDSTIVYVKKGVSSYNVETGEQIIKLMELNLLVQQFQMGLNMHNMN